MIPDFNVIKKDVKDKLVGNCIIDMLRYMSDGVSGKEASSLLIKKYGHEICYRAIFRLEDLFE